MSDSIRLESIQNVPYINQGDNVAEIVLATAQSSGLSFQENDILCVASKAVSIAEGRFKSLADVEVSDVAKRMHETLSRKDPRVIQVIIDETGAPDGSKIDLSESYIAGWLPNGLRLTSSGVDKHGAEEVILLPEDADASARAIGKTILDITGINVGVIITDSDGRMDKRGAIQVAVGVYGVPPLRVTEATDDNGNMKKIEETVCDMLAASAALIMGQRGTNKPAVLIRGYKYDFDKSTTIARAVVGN